MQVLAPHFVSQSSSLTFWLRGDNLGHSDGRINSDRAGNCVLFRRQFHWQNGESVISSDNDIDDIPVADTIINDDGGEEEIFHRDFRWEIMDSYKGHREVFSCDFGPRNGAENVSGIVQCFELFFNKGIIQLSGKLISTQNNINTPEAIFSHLDHL